MCRFWLKFAAGSVVGRMAAVCKQLEASQSFLRQVAALPNFAALRVKHHAVLLTLGKKTKALNLKDANNIFQMMDALVWSDELSETLRAAVSQCLVVEHAVEEASWQGRALETGAWS